MAGQVMMMINRLISIRANGDPDIAEMTRIKLLMKGINVEKWTQNSVDDPEILQQLHDIAKQMSLSL